ncbi:MAG: ATP-binding protein [Anaerolineales bacterium]
MQKLLHKLIPRQIQWKGSLLESILFLAAYIAWVIFRSPQSYGRLFIGSLAVLVPGIAAVILVFQFLPQFPPASRSAWRFLGLGLGCWSLGNLVRTYYEGLRGLPVPIISLADIFSFLAYALLLLALVLYPFENRYAPTRFRFLLDVTISAGVVATLAWIIVGRPGGVLHPAQVVPLVYPIADLVLLMLLVNMLLANRTARRTLFLWGGGFFAFLVSDYIYSLLAPVNGYQAGGPESIGWVLGGLLFGWGAVFLASVPPAPAQPDQPASDLGTRLQNLLPFVLVVVLAWFILVDWRLTGRLPGVAAGACLFLVLALGVRMGVRAGEIELHQYWQLFSRLAEPVFICDGSGKILLGNPALLRALGLQEAGQVTGRSLTEIFEGQALPAGLLERAALQECSLEVRLRPNETACLLSLSPIFSEGRRVLLAGAVHDLSDQKRQQAAIQKGYTELQVLHRQLEDLNTQLEQKVEERTHTLSVAYQQLEEQNKLLQELDQLKSDFISMVSHELRTPLTSLNGGLELLLLQKERSAQDRSTLTLMKEEVGRLTRMVENILTLTATQAGRIQLDLKALALDEVLRSVCRGFETVPGAQQIQVRLPADLPPVLADAGILASIFNHLLDNALKYAPSSPVLVEAVRVRSRVRVQVTDGGPGIPEAKRPLLFQRFQRLDARDSQSVYGYGLGLYLSQRMLRAMQSDLVFEAPEQGGARFTFSLKVAR